MPVPNFFQQQQQSMQTGLGLGQAMQKAQQSALLDPSRQKLLQSQIAGQETQNQLGQARLSGVQQKTEEEERENKIKGFRQDVGMLFAYNDDPKTYDKALEQILPKYANDPLISPFMERLTEDKDPKKRTAALLGMMGALNPLKGKNKFQKAPEGMVFNPRTGSYSRDPTFFENQQDINKLEIEQKKELHKLDVELTKSKERIKGLAEREKVDIDDGLLAAQTMPILMRADKLLDIVETGKPRQALLWAKKWFGLEGASEVELENLMGKQILKQLKPVFGSQFTKGEGDWLKAMEADFGKSTVGNRALIRQGIELVRMRADIGLEAARFAGDARSGKNIQGYLDFTFSDDPQAEKKTTELTDADILSKYGVGQ